MKSKLLAVIIVAVLSLGVCPALVSCGSNPTPVVSDPTTTGTEEPAPDETPEPGDEETGIYYGEIAAISEELGTAYYSLDELLLMLEFEDDGWVAEVALAQADIIMLCEEAAEIVPPEAMIETHATYLEAIMHFNDAMEILNTGMDTADVDLLSQASAEMWLASEVMDTCVGDIQGS